MGSSRILEEYYNDAEMRCRAFQTRQRTLVGARRLEVDRLAKSWLKVVIFCR